MRFAYFPETDTIDIELLTGPSAEGFDVAEDVIGTAKADGRLSSLTIAHASERTSLEYLNSSDPDLEWLVETRDSGRRVQRVPNQRNGDGRIRAGLIRCTYVQAADILEIQFAQEKPAGDVLVAPSIWLELDDRHRVVGLHIGFASHKISDMDPTGMTPCVEWRTHIGAGRLVPAT